MPGSSGSRSSRRRPGRPRNSRPASAGGRPRRPTTGHRPPARPPASGARAALERRSGPFLVLLTRLPRWLVAALMAALLVAGFVLRGPVGAVCLVLLAAFLGWLLALSWPVLSASARGLRFGVVVALLAVAGLRLAGL